MTGKTSEANTENLFRTHCGVGAFLEKSAIPNEFGFRSKKDPTNAGFPDFFLDDPDFFVVVEAKATNHGAAKAEAQFYACHNDLKKDGLAIAVSGQDAKSLRVSYYFRDFAAGTVLELASPKDALLTATELAKLFTRTKYGSSTTTESLVAVLKNLNNRFHKEMTNVRHTDRSLFFSGLMIALNHKNFRATYQNISEPTQEEAASIHAAVLKAHHLNRAIVQAISSQLNSKANNLSKQLSWEDQFSFIKNIDCPLHAYKSILKTIEDKIYKPFKNDEKQDILGRAYKIFLSRAGKAENKNIILTPDHVKSLMVKLAGLAVDDVVLDTCTGSGGFLMESMETLVALSQGDPAKIQHIKERQLIGFESDSVLFALACSNMFLHGDGKTNLLCRSSLLGADSHKTVNSTDQDLLTYIRGLRPNKCIINPPYENNLSFEFTEQAIDYLEKDGRLVIVMPTPTLSQNEKNGGVARLLSVAQLDFVIKMPDDLFSEQSRRVQTSIFGFTKTPHAATKKVLFYDLADDGMESIQHKGKVDKCGVWPGIERDVLDVVGNRTVVPGVSEMRAIVKPDGNFHCAGIPPKMVSKNGWAMVRVGDLFDMEKGTFASSNVVPGAYDFIAAGAEWKRHATFTHDKEALVYVVSSDGSHGRCHYVNGKFTASNLCVILTPKTIAKASLDLRFYQQYFEAARPKITRELEEGTSKKTINPRRFLELMVECPPLAEQTNIHQRMTKLHRIRRRIDEQIRKEIANQTSSFYDLRPK